jgi:aspartate aminotransferase
MAPGSGFYTNPEDGRHQVRMAYILNKEDLAKAVLVLRKALEAYQNEKQ